MLYGSFALLAILFILPCTALALTSSINIPAGNVGYVLCNGSSGSFTSSGTVDAFISDMSGITHYTTYGTIPSGALWDTTGTSGSFSGITVTGGTYYLVFGNKGGSSVSVEYTINAAIPGFEIIFVMFAIIAFSSIVILWRKKLN